LVFGETIKWNLDAIQTDHSFNFQYFLNYNDKHLLGPKKSPQGSNLPLPRARCPPTITKATITMVIRGMIHLKHKTLEGLWMNKSSKASSA
jgi:hypothetical protein